MRRGIVLGGKFFATTKEAEAHYKTVKATAAKNTWIQEPFLVDVYNCNPHVPFNVTRIKFVRHEVDRFADWGVIAGGDNGEETDRPISRNYAFHKRSVSATNHKRLRLLVQQDVEEYRCAMIEAAEPCQTCGLPYDDAKQFDADHIRPFRNLVADWLAREGIKHETLRWEVAGNDKWFQLLPEHLHESWVVFHLEECELQWLCRPCHKKKTNEDR